MNSKRVTNIVFAGLGGMGVLKASDICAGCAFQSGFDVKKSEIHGMSQRGGSVTSDVRFGAQVFSPMVPVGEADFLVVLDETQIVPTRHMLRPEGMLITPAPLVERYGPLAELGIEALPLTSRNCNVALLGMLSTALPFSEAAWYAAITGCLPEQVHEQNVKVFQLGRQLGVDTVAPCIAVAGTTGG